MSEQAIQERVVVRLRRARLRFCAVPNGGKRNPREAAALKRAGLSPGVPDLLVFDPALPVRAPMSPEEAALAEALAALAPERRAVVLRAAGAPLALELKRDDGGRVSAEQRDWLAALKALGWNTAICAGLAEADALLDDLYGVTTGRTAPPPSSKDSGVALPSNTRDSLLARLRSRGAR